jgi:hypothetical protein
MREEETSVLPTPALGFQPERWEKRYSIATAR